MQNKTNERKENCGTAVDPGKRNPLLRLVDSFSIYRGLPKSIYTLFIATVVNGIGIFVFPFLTLFLTKKMGMGEKAAGDFMLLASLAYVPGILTGGKLADHFGRKRVMLISQALSGLLFVPCGFLGTSPLVPWLILASLFFDGVTDPARTAMNMDVTTPENRQAAFSLLYLGHNLGFAFGPLIAGFLFEKAPEWLFWGNAMAILAALALVIAFIPETKPTERQIEESLAGNSTERAHEGSLISALKSRAFLLVFVSITTWLGFVYAQNRFALPLQLQATFSVGGAKLYGVIMTLNAALVIVFNAPIVATLRRFRPLVNVSIAGFLYTAGFGMLALVRSPVLFFVSTILWTFGEIVHATNEEVYVANHTPMSHRGRFNSILPLISGVGFSISSSVAGRIIERAGLRPVWWLMGAVALLASCALLVLDRAERKAASRVRTGGAKKSGESIEPQNRSSV